MSKSRRAPPPNTGRQPQSMVDERRRAWQEFETLAEQAAEAGSWVAAVKAREAAIHAREALEVALLAPPPPEKDPSSGASISEMVEELVAMIAELPDLALPRIAAALRARLGGRGEDA